MGGSRLVSVLVLATLAGAPPATAQPAPRPPAKSPATAQPAPSPPATPAPGEPAGEAAGEPAGEAASEAEVEIEMDPTPANPAAPASEPAGAAAEPAPPAAPVKDPRLARRWLAAARTLIRRGDYYTRAKRPDDATAQYANAVVALGKAIEAGDDLGVYVELAVVEGKLGKLDEAVKHLRKVTAATTGVRADVQKKAAAKLEEFAAKVGIVALAIEPAGATVTLSGTELGTAPLGEPLVLLPGTYQLLLHAEGFQPKETELIVEAGAESERTIALEPIPIIIVEPKPRPPEEPAEVADTGKRSKLPLYIGGGATLGLATVATVTGILALGQHGTFTSSGSSSLERIDARANGQTLARVTDVFLAGTVVAAGFTAYWYFFKYRRKPENKPWGRVVPPMAKLDMVPWVQPDASGFSLAGSF